MKLSVLFDEARDRGWDEGLQYNEAVGDLMLVPENINSSDEKRLGLCIPPAYDMKVYAPPQTNEPGCGASTPNDEAGGVAGL